MTPPPDSITCCLNHSNPSEPDECLKVFSWLIQKTFCYSGNLSDLKNIYNSTPLPADLKLTWILKFWLAYVKIVFIFIQEKENLIGVGEKAHGPDGSYLFLSILTIIFSFWFPFLLKICKDNFEFPALQSFQLNFILSGTGQWLQPNVSGEIPHARGQHSVGLCGDYLVLHGGSSQFDVTTMQCKEQLVDTYIAKTGE